MRVAIEILSVYSLYALGVAILISRFATKDRVSTVVLAWLVPIVSVVAFFWGTLRLFWAKSHNVKPCPYGLEEAENFVAKRRQEMFGGEFRPTHFASAWRLNYGMAFDREVIAIRDIARKLFAYA